MTAMKSLFDRTRVYVYADTPDVSTEGADGIAVTLLADNGLNLRGTDYDGLDALCRAYADGQFDVLLCIPALDEEQIKLVANCATRHAMWGRILFASAAHKTLDAIKGAYPEARITPICDENMVRPWIYAAYMGAPAYCMEAREILLDADAWGAPTVDRAHNANVCIFAHNADDEDTVKALVRVGCDAVLTHDAKMARALVW